MGERDNPHSFFIMILTKDNFIIFAAHYYDNATCTNTEEFLSDLNHFKYLKKLFSRYRDNGDLKERLIINHITIILNLFGTEPAVKMLFHKTEIDTWSYLKTFLLFLNVMPDIIQDIEPKSIISADIPIDINIANILRKI